MSSKTPTLKSKQVKRSLSPPSPPEEKEELLPAVRFCLPSGNKKPKVVQALEEGVILRDKTKFGLVSNDVLNLIFSYSRLKDRISLSRCTQSLRQKNSNIALNLSSIRINFKLFQKYLKSNPK